MVLMDLAKLTTIFITITNEAYVNWIRIGSLLKKLKSSENLGSNGVLFLVTNGNDHFNFKYKWIALQLLKTA